MSDVRKTQNAAPCCGEQATPAASPCCGGQAAASADSACCGSSHTETIAATPAPKAAPRRLNIELLVIDLDTCARCVPTSAQLRSAIELVAPAADALDIGLTYRETVVETAEEAKARALLSSPTIRINGRDIDQDVRESECESCRDLTEGAVSVECREWHYRGQIYTAPPLPFLVETLMGALLTVDEMLSVRPEPLQELPANLVTYFANRKSSAGSGCCC